MIEKAQGGHKVQDHREGLDEKKEMVDSTKQRENTMNKDFEFRFIALWRYE